VVQALRLNTMSKLTFADSSRFDALVRDVFSGIDFINVDDQILMHALEQVYKEAQLELIPSQVCVRGYHLLSENVNVLWDETCCEMSFSQFDKLLTAACLL